MLITRPAEQARSTVKSLKEMGFEPLVDPLLTIKPVAVDLSSEDPCAFIVTSANAVHAIPEAYLEQPVFAVGQATALALESHGCKNVYVGGGSADYLLPLIKENRSLLTGKAIYLAGDHVKVDIDGHLRELGYDAARYTSYQSVAAEHLSDDTLDAIENETLGAVTFFSPRSGQIFVDLVRSEGLEEMFDEVGAVCLSPTIARSVSPIHWRRLLISPARTQSALLACLERLG